MFGFVESQDFRSSPIPSQAQQRLRFKERLVEMRKEGIEAPLKRIEGGGSIQEPQCTATADESVVEETPDAMSPDRYIEESATGHARPLPLLAESGNLPTEPNRTIVELMPVDPRCAYAYWELPLEGMSRETSTLGGLVEPQAILRIMDASMTGSADPTGGIVFTKNIELTAGSCYIPSLTSGRPYFAEIGRKTPGENFVAVVRSSTATMPSASPLPQNTESYMLVSESYDIVTFIPHPLSLASRQILDLSHTYCDDEGPRGMKWANDPLYVSGLPGWEDSDVIAGLHLQFTDLERAEVQRSQTIDVLESMTKGLSHACETSTSFWRTSRADSCAEHYNGMESHAPDLTSLSEKSFNSGNVVSS